MKNGKNLVNNHKKRKIRLLCLFLLMTCIILASGISAAAARSASSQFGRSKGSYHYIKMHINESFRLSQNLFDTRVRVKSSDPKIVKVKKVKDKFFIRARGSGLATVQFRGTDRLTKYVIYVFKNKSEERTLNQLFLNKKLSVLGDSLSSHQELKVGEYRYYNSVLDQPEKVRLDIRDEYWAMIKELFQMEMGVNYSIAGAMISGYNQSMALASNYKVQKLGLNGKPDVIMYFGGTNDYLVGRRTKNKVGKFNPKSPFVTKAINKITNQDTYPDFVSGYIVSLRRLKYAYPKAKIIAIIPWMPEGSPYWKEMIKVCKFYHLQYVRLSEANLTERDMAKGIHVNQQGYLKITNCILQSLGRKK